MFFNLLKFSKNNRHKLIYSFANYALQSSVLHVVKIFEIKIKLIEGEKVSIQNN